MLSAFALKLNVLVLAVNQFNLVLNELHGGESIYNFIEFEYIIT